MRTNKSFPAVAFLCYLFCFYACQTALPIPEPTLAEPMLLTGQLLPNPLYQEYDDDQDPYIVQSLNLSDTSGLGLGPIVQEGRSISFLSCKYVFVESKLADMYVVGEDCEDLRLVPYAIDVANERLQFLVFDSLDGFWECWEEGDRVGRFRIWVRENKGH